MSRIGILVAAVVVGCGALVGCGGGDGGSNSDDYCATLKKTKSDLSNLDGNKAPSSAALERTKKSFHDLRDQAPSSIKDDWTTLSKKLDTFLAALDSAGLSPGDLDAPDKILKLSADKRKKLTDAAQGLSSLKEPQDAIEKHAKKTCKIDLGSDG